MVVEGGGSGGGAAGGFIPLAGFQLDIVEQGHEPAALAHSLGIGQHLIEELGIPAEHLQQMVFRNMEQEPAEAHGLTDDLLPIGAAAAAVGGLPADKGCHRHRRCHGQGNAAETAEENGCYTITMHRTGAPAQEMPEELLNCAVPAASDYVVFAGRDVIGEGDPELGHSLIKMFFYTLSEKPDLPSAICFMNNGVRLVTENEQAIEHLKVLEAKGVKLIVCGTCLNFYGLTDKLQCGTIGNMYDIVETMTKAGKVITV